MFTSSEHDRTLKPLDITNKNFQLINKTSKVSAIIFSLNDDVTTDDPFELLHSWIIIKKSLDSDDYYYATASLATVDHDGYPDAHMLTLKEFHEDHILFTTPITPSVRLRALMGIRKPL